MKTEIGTKDMKAILEFDLLDNDDKQTFEEMTQAKDVLSFIFDWENQLRYWRKYSDKEPDFDEIDDKYHEMIREANLKTW
jgi:hypothetical protein